MKLTMKNSVLAMTLLTCMNVFAAPVYFNSEEGMNRLLHADHRSDFPRLANYYEAQENKVFCGVATITIVLNALKVKALDQATEIPYDTTLVGSDEKGYFPSKNNWQPYFHRYTQRTVLTHSPKSRLEIMGKPTAEFDFVDYGLQLAQFTDMVKSNGVHIRTVELAKLDNPAAVKADMIRALDKKDNYLVANYSRKSVEQKGGGHLSPVAAYDSQSDSFLVLDVNSAKYPWAWIDADKFIQAMHTKDVSAYRGYAVISN
ncbi:Phytochelatin synthase [Vibrio aerogenes CECT 7868]|uniref:glutathione gamma-glutamylcysteinyltransferase n=1 Tax=Vibrio aerogenes CECT 7868 TaxID=1216006 RepID=A0A1M6DJR3_9VIBR|nr:phytochelatin synthase family protein [Vibrio aerogenes]SHI73381.1 Phytochelatin synthase [Vibrio aerogenes CECT 7868]